MKPALLLLILVAFALQLSPSFAQVPGLLNYQGRITVGTTNFDGIGQFKFALVNGNASTTYWSNDGTSTAGSEPTAGVLIPVVKGLYSVQLGDTGLEHMSALPATVFSHGDVNLRVWFNDGTTGFQLLGSDKRIAAVGYAMMAESVTDGAISTAKLADGAVNTAKLADASVTGAKIASGAIDSTHLATGLTLGGTTSGTFSGGLTGNVAGNATNFTGSLMGDVTGTQGATVVSVVGTSTAANLHAAELAANAATAANTASTLVKRDASGNFSAGTITAELAGNATTATTATTATNFTGSLGGDVTGTQSATAIAATTVTGKALTGYLSGAGTITASDSILTAINKLNGNSALKAPLASPVFTGTVTLPAGTTTVAPLLLTSGTNLTTPIFGALEFDGTSIYLTNNSATPTRKTIAFTDSIVSSSQLAANAVDSSKIADGSIVNADIQASAAIADTKLATLSTAGKVANSATTGTAANTPNTLVLRDASGNFAAGTITANLTGNVSGSAASFTGSLVGDVTGTQGATVVSAVGSSSAANVHTAELAANAATSANTASTIVKRDGSGNFAAGTVTIGGGLSLPATTSATVGTISQGGNALLHTYGTDNFFAGTAAGNVAMTGGQNCAVGQFALAANTTGGANASLGAFSLRSNTTGLGNTAVGYNTLNLNTTGYRNTAHGVNVLVSNVNGNQNTGAGVNTLELNTSGSDNAAYGAFALAQNTTGNSNTAIGYNALNANTTGHYNIGIGNIGGANLTTGNDNIAIGNAGVAGESSTIRIGTSGTHTSAYIAGISGVTASGGAAVFVNTSGKLGTITSSRRFKDHILRMDGASEVIHSLRPVTFRYKPELDPVGIAQFGLIAEEVAEIAPELVVRDERGEINTVRYEQINAMLLNEFLKDHRRLTVVETTLREENATMKKRIAELEAQEASHEERLKKLEQFIAPVAQPAGADITLKADALPIK